MEDTHFDIDTSMEYRGEGSCSIVLAIPKSNQVLRLVKSAYTENIQKKLEKKLSVDVTCEDVQEAVKDQLISAINYIENIVQPILSEDYVIVPTLVCVPKGFIHKALAVTEAARPAHRRTSYNLVDYNVQWALILPDCCFVRNKGHNKSIMNHFLRRNLVHEIVEEMPTNPVENSNNIASKLDSWADHNVVKNSCLMAKAMINSRKDTSDPPSQSKNVPHRQTSACHNIGENQRLVLTVPPNNQARSEECLDFVQDDINSRKTFTLSFEIKPKKGFMLPTTEGRSQSQTCKFCRHQCLKTKSGKFSEFSGYCPLNLFSGDRERMRHALFALIKTPQHNLKICKDGKEVYGSEIREDLGDLLSQWFPQGTNNHGKPKDEFVRDFVDIIIETLLNSPQDTSANSTAFNSMTGGDSVLQNSNSNVLTSKKALDSKASLPELQGDGKRLAADVMNLSCANSSFNFKNDDGNCKKINCLPRGCVLEQIRRMQLLDQLDIESVYPIFNALITEQEKASELRGLPLNGPYTDVSWILGHETEPAGIQQSDRSQFEKDLLKVKRFLLSKTFQDCSIIVAIRPIIQNAQEPSDFSLKYQDVLYDFSVSIIDLDPKPYEKIPFYYSQAMEIASAFVDVKS